MAPDRAPPVVSAVLVSHGSAHLTRRSLAALAANTEVAWEAIVVDNGSDAQTRAALSQLPDAQVVLNAANLGFGPASNQGAALAAGEYLLLLNSDAFVHPGWFAPLAAALTDDHTVAAVPKLLNEDGTLQEAGVLLAQDGGVRLYGDGDAADDARYNFRRYIDAGSAAVMLLNRKSFLSLDGFDDAFAPAYYEDADLCMRIAAAGRRIAYEPTSVATHIRYGSSDHASAQAMSERNRERFVQRWTTQLAGRPVSFDGASRQALISARDIDAHPRVLLCPYDADPGGGAAAASAQLADRLIEHWPLARLTWVGAPLTALGADHLSPWVEVIDEPDASVLEDRLFHYDVVISVGEPAGAARSELRAVLSHTQPQAERVELSQLSSASDAELLAAFARAGVLSPG